VIPPGDYDFLYQAGAVCVFGPGTAITDSANKVLNALDSRKSASCLHSTLSPPHVQGHWGVQTDFIEALGAIYPNGWTSVTGDPAPPDPGQSHHPDRKRSTRAPRWGAAWWTGSP
jgi:hypothetical protein